MATAADTIEKGLKAQVKAGQVNGGVRNMLVTELTQTSWESWVEEILGATGLPAYGSVVNIDGTVLRVEDYEIDVVPGDPSKANVAVKYVKDTFDSPIDKSFTVISIQGGLRQVLTDKDKDGDRQTVEHEGVSQPALFDYEESTFIINWVERRMVQFIYNHAKTYHNKINSSSWAGEDAGLWRLTVNNTRLIDEVNREYEIDYTAELNLSGWNPEVYFTDESETPLPEDELEDGVGYKTIERYDEVDFNQLLPTREFSS